MKKMIMDNMIFKDFLDIQCSYVGLGENTDSLKSYLDTSYLIFDFVFLSALCFFADFHHVATMQN